MENEKVYRMSFSKVYPLLVGKALKKGRTTEEEDQVIRRFTANGKPEHVSYPHQRPHDK